MIPQIRASRRRGSTQLSLQRDRLLIPKVSLPLSPDPVRGDRNQPMKRIQLLIYIIQPLRVLLLLQLLYYILHQA